VLAWRNLNSFVCYLGTINLYSSIINPGIPQCIKCITIKKPYWINTGLLDNYFQFIRGKLLNFKVAIISTINKLRILIIWFFSSR